MTHTYLSQLIVPLKNTGATILLALTAHQTPTCTGWSRTRVAIILRIYVSLQGKPRIIRKECELLIDLTFHDRL
jgi:hypothetical protein